MINEIYFDGKLILQKIEDGEVTFEDGTTSKWGQLLKKPAKIRCRYCKKLRDIKINYHQLKNKYLCIECIKGPCNGMRGKKHTEEFKKKLSADRKGKRLNPHNKSLKEYWAEKYSAEEIEIKYQRYIAKQREVSLGEKNHFYGKCHSDVSKKKMQKASKEHWDAMSPQEQEESLRRLNEGMIKFRENNPEQYIENKRKAAKASHARQEKYILNKPEKLVKQALIDRELDFEYSTILDKYQYDFGSQEYRILLEVQGDYWHVNPKLYSNDDLTEPQRKNLERDARKEQWAIDHDFLIYFIWEQDILNGNFEVLDQIQRKIYEIQTYTSQKD